MDKNRSSRSTGLRIAVVDQREDVRSGLVRMLKLDGRMSWVAGAATVDGASEDIVAMRPNAVLIDPGASDAGARSALLELVDLRDRTEWFLIVVYVARDDPSKAREAVRLGADLCLLKGLRTTDLVAEVLNGLPQVA